MIFCILCVFFHCFYLKKSGLRKNVKVSHKTMLPMKFTSNLLHGFIVSYSAICGCLQLALLVFLSPFLLRNNDLGKCSGF